MGPPLWWTRVIDIGCAVATQREIIIEQANRSQGDNKREHMHAPMPRIFHRVSPQFQEESEVPDSSFLLGGNHIKTVSFGFVNIVQFLKFNTYRTKISTISSYGYKCM